MKHAKGKPYSVAKKTAVSLCSKTESRWPVSASREIKPIAIGSIVLDFIACHNHRSIKENHKKEKTVIC